jgi:GT2 family glycosyltransferase
VELAPLISVIIVNFNGKDLLRDCIEALYNQSFEDLEVIVVDNASSDGSVQYLRTTYPDIKLLPLSENSGFAKANKEGLKAAHGNYIMLFNNDIEANKDCIKNLYEAMNAHPDVGICASKMIVYGQDTIDSAGDGFITSLKGYKRGEGLPSGLYNSEEYIFGACAGAALYRRKMLDEIGFLDEDFFLIHEDSDFNFRAQLSGWKTFYVPSAVVYHKVRSSIGSMSDNEVYYTLRNIEFVRIKNIPVGLFIRCLPGFIIGTVSEFLYYALKHGKLGLFLKAKKDALKKLGPMLEKRKEIMKLKKVDTGYLSSIMTPIWKEEFFSMKIKKLFSKK